MAKIETAGMLEIRGNFNVSEVIDSTRIFTCVRIAFDFIKQILSGRAAMSFRGAVLISLFFFLLAGTASAGAKQDEELKLDFTFAITEPNVVEKSKELQKSISAFVDNNKDGVYDEVHFDGQVIEAKVDVEDAQGFSFSDGTKMAFFPTQLNRLPAPGTYEVIGFLHHWSEDMSRVVAILIREDKDYETSEGITVYVIDRSGVRVGALFYMFMEKGLLRYTEPYQKWMQTGIDFAIGTSPTVSNYFLMGKDLGLVDTVLIFNVSLSGGPTPAGQDFELRRPEPGLIKESLSRPDTWGVFSGGGEGGVFSTVNLKGESISGDIQVDKAQGLSFGDGRSLVFYPSTLDALPASPAEGINWGLLGFVHYFDKDGKIDTMLGVLLGQVAGDETSLGLRVKVVDNAGMEVGMPKFSFFPSRAVRNISSYSTWEQSGNDFSLGFVENIRNRFYLTKDLGLIDKMLVIRYQLY
jgi:hypothetical protein